MIEYILGILTGLLISIINIVLFERFKIPIQRNIEQLRNTPIIQGGSNKAFIAGMSEEESSYMEAITRNEKPIL
jgi:hypothetical protein